MRQFLHTHWKLIAILLAIVLALITAEIDSAPAAPPLAARLRAHVEATGAATHDAPGRYVESTLKRFGYAPVRGRRTRDIEVSIANLAPGARPERVFIVGDRGSGTAAVLELARILKTMRPSRGTEIRFVFFAGQPPTKGEDAPPESGSFIAFAGTMEASARVRQALDPFRELPAAPDQGLATPAHVMGVTLSDHRNRGRHGFPALLVTETGFLAYPYHRTADKVDVDDMARVVTGLARTIAALAGPVRT
jgi:hypothetical protein